MRLCRLLLILAVLLVIYGIAVLALAAPWFLVIPVAFVAYRRRKWFWSGAHGTARWAGASDLKGMVGADQGIIVGRLTSPTPSLSIATRALFSRRVPSDVACQDFLRALWKKPRTDLVRLSTSVHTAVFAPTGVGKGVSIVIPHLLTCPDSLVVVDFKGELARATAEHRRRAFSHRIVLLDPFRVVTKEPDAFNPLEWIDRGDMTAIDECRDLAEALVVRTGQEKEPHWLDSAEVWIASMIALVVVMGEDDRSLQTVRSVLTDPQKMDAAVKLMCSSTAWDGMLSRLGHQLSQFMD
jgi:type IV secretion system protein VirD4